MVLGRILGKTRNIDERFGKLGVFEVLSGFFLTRSFLNLLTEPTAPRLACAEMEKSGTPDEKR